MPLPDLNTPDEIRAFLRLCLKPPARGPRTPAKLAKVMPDRLRERLHEHAPHLAELDAEVTRLERATERARGAHAKALARWIDGIEPEPSAAVDEEQTPVQLRWGLDDIMYGDDDTTTVMLSDDQRRPYWLELDPERTAVLRQYLAGPNAEPAGELADVVEQAATALEAQTCTCGCRRGVGFLRHLAETVRTTGAFPTSEETPHHG